MIGRMLFVWLLVLNLGVAAWWWLNDAREPAIVGDAAESESPIPRLELVDEARESAADATPAVTANVEQAPTATPDADAGELAVEPAPAAPVCASFGPYPDQGAAATARAALPSGAQAEVRSVGAARARGFNVSMPPLADREAAQSMAARLRAAGFNDLIVIGEGPDANGIALGRFGSEDNARRHQAALQAKGFTAQIVPVGGDGGAQFWLDVRAPAGFDASAQRTRLSAAQARPRDC